MLFWPVCLGAIPDGVQAVHEVKRERPWDRHRRDLQTPERTSKTRARKERWVRRLAGRDGRRGG